MGIVQDEVARVLSENFDIFDVIDDFAVNLVENEPRQNEEENLVWSNSNSSLKENLVQVGTNSNPGQCGRMKVVRDTPPASLDFQRTVCNDADLLPLCMVQQGEDISRRVPRRRKKRNKQKQLRWRQRRSRERGLGLFREGRQTAE